MNLEDASVLLVEDEPLLCEAMTAWLGRVAGRAACAEHGKKALRLLHTDRFDVVVSDVRMPVMDGIELLATINRLKPGKPPVILVTGFSDLTVREAYDYGAEAMLEKPVDRQELLLLMRRALVPLSERCRQPRRRGAEMKMRNRFESLTSAMDTKKIAFGRKGFCIHKPGGLREGLLDFTFELNEDRRVFAGQGHVRWTAPEEDTAGVEITYLHDSCRSWFLDVLRRAAPVASIPASTVSTTALRSLQDVA